MSLREYYNETTWKIYRLAHKTSFWACLILIIGVISAISVLIIKVDDIAYNRLIQSPNIDNCNKYLVRYSKSEHISNVSQLLNSLLIQKEKDDFKYALETESLDACNKFIQEYPESEHLQTIKDKMVDIEYQQVCKSDMVPAYRTFLQKYPSNKYEQEIKGILKRKEDDFYKQYINIKIASVSRTRLNEYKSMYPDGRYTKQVNEKLRRLDDEEAYQFASSSNTKSAWEQYLSVFPKGVYAAKARTKINEFNEIERCRNNSLSNGSQPYAKYYGYNYSYDWNRAAVKVNASSYSDVVVIVRYNNSSGKVAGHSYIRKGCSSTIYLPENRRYQVFFYYGSGWYPKKDMSGEVKGGFLERETFSKDGSSMYLSAGDMVTYTLTQQVNGNFSTSGSSKSEMF